MKRVLGIFLLFMFSQHSLAGWGSTGWVESDEVVIHMDTGKTFFTITAEVTTLNSAICEHSRLELRDTGDYYNSTENAARMFSLILTAKTLGKRIKLGYNDGDGPQCRVAQAQVDW